MNKLEQYIHNNKSRFDEEPPEFHFERLQQKINRKSGRIKALSWSISIAASIAIAFLAGMIGLRTHKQEEKMVLCENSTDMKSCYLNKMNVVAVQIKGLTEKLDLWDQQQVLNDVQNIINDTANGDFESEIPEELPAKKAKSILSDYYRQNLESLETIAKELKSYEL
jgi:methyl-accepting chemotaxis protein